MSAIVQMNKIPIVQWKGQTFEQIQSFIRKNERSGVNEKLKFRANPLKIYRREIVTSDVDVCNARTSTKIDIFNQPNGTIINSTASNKNGLVNLVDNNIPNNSCDTYENCSVILSPAENAKKRVRSSGMMRKKYDASRDSDNYYTSSKQYLASRNLSFQQNQYNYIRSGDASAKPGTNLASNNLYKPNGLNTCKKFYISQEVSFQYIWIDGTTVTVTVPSGYYYLNEINQLLKLAMIENHHYYTKDQVGLNPDPYHDVLTFLLNISYDTNNEVIQLQSFRTDVDTHPSSDYSIPGDATWTQPPNTTPKFPQLVVPSNILQNAFGFAAATYPTNQTANASENYQIFSSSVTPELLPNYTKLYYKPNNPQFAQQGAVSSGDLITRKRYDTITNSAATYRNALGQSVANALAYGVPANGYTIKDKMGYPLKQTPTFSKYNDEMKKCTVTSFSNKI